MVYCNFNYTLLVVELNRNVNDFVKSIKNQHLFSTQIIYVAEEAALQ